MSLVTRSPVRPLTAPSTAPQEAMIASLQSHIDELVQKNRASEHTIKRLQQTLTDEEKRAADAVVQMKLAAKKENEEWKEGCDSLLASHRIVHLRTLIELDKERTNLLKERQENRRDRAAILHRDFKLTLFMAQQSDLEGKIADLEDSLEELAEQNEQDAADYVAEKDEALATLRLHLSKSETLRKEAVSKVRVMQGQFQSIEASVLNLFNISFQATNVLSTERVR